MPAPFTSPVKANLILYELVDRFSASCANGFLLAWMIGRDTIAALRKQQSIAIKLNGALNPPDNDEMISPLVLGFAAALEEGGNAVENWRAIHAF